MALLIAVAAAGVPPVNLEGLTYDDTIEALTSLDPAVGDLTFSVRRLQRVPRVSVTLTFPPEDDRLDETLTLIPGQPLRSTMLSKGIKLNDPLARRFDAGCESLLRLIEHEPCHQQRRNDRRLSSDTILVRLNARDFAQTAPAIVEARAAAARVLWRWSRAQRR